ncbi:MAG: MoaD/ThiS family protein [Thermoleophilia bacterium]|nr:MoaD/ThiS family protein [Thermoleophilia bacterium]
MEVEVRLPVSLGSFRGDGGTVVADGEDISGVIESLGMMFEGLKDELIDARRQAWPNVRIFLNGEDIRYLNDLNTAVREGDVISIMPAVSG